MPRQCRELPLDPPDDTDDGDGEREDTDEPDDDPEAGDRAAADYWDRVVMRDPR